MKVFLDDERQPPPGWRLARWPDEVIELLGATFVTHLSLDHDLGDDERGTGYDVVRWVEEAVATRGFVPPEIRVHSANSSARVKMELGIAQIQRFAERLGARPIPMFMDFEASSLSPLSHPIEVAWTTETGEIESHLISPEHVDEWIDWSAESEKIHGISRAVLLEKGASPTAVMERLKGRSASVAYCDAPDHDGRWLSRLAFAARSEIALALQHTDGLFVRALHPGMKGRAKALGRLAEIKAEQRDPEREHRAAWDVDYLFRVWRAVKSARTVEP